jgi:hypothetical protein
VSSAVTNQTLPVVVSAIAGDISTLTNTPDDHDPLGLAFYFFAARYSDYKNENLDYLHDVAKLWVQEKLNGDALSPYLDRDIGALALFLFTLKRYCLCSEPSSQFAEIISKHAQEDTGLFRNFFVSAISALGLMAACPTSDALLKLEAFLKREIAQRPRETFNDAKNLAIAYLMAKEWKDSELTSFLIQESQRKLKGGDLPRSDRIFPNFVLVSEVARLPREDQAFVKRSCEESLDFVKTYSLEVSYPPELVDQYSTDVSLSSAGMEGNGHRSRPRLSRIMLSFSLVLLRLYDKAQMTFLTREVRAQNVMRGSLYGALWLGVAAGLFWLGAQLGLPYDLKQYYPAHPLKLLARLVADMMWVSAILLPVFPAFIFFDRLVIKGQDLGEVSLLRQSWAAIKEHWVIKILLAGVLAWLRTLFP